MPTLFMKVDGLEGVDPMLDDGGFIAIAAYSHGLSVPLANRRSQGATVGMRRASCDHGDFVISRITDTTSPTFFRACAACVSFKGVAIHACRNTTINGDSALVPHLSIFLSDALITSFSYECNGEIPMETISFAYGSIDWSFKPVDPEDHEPVSGSFDAGWDGTKNKSAIADDVNPLIKSLKVPEPSGGGLL